MTGHVFHPGHDQLHGITVVLETTGKLMYVGRFDRQDETGVHLIGVSVFDPAQGTMSRTDFLSRTVKFGVRIDRPHLVVPGSQVSEITPLGDIASA
jgi:hypothetical protein